MGRGAPLLLRIPLLLLAIIDLVVLSLRLWPWQEIAYLPNAGTTGYDPIICLVTYIGLVYWLSGNCSQAVRKALSAGTIMGLPAGLLLVAHTTLARWPGMQIAYFMIGLLIVAGILWGIAGSQASRATGNAGLGIVAGIWSAMVSALIGSGAALAEINLQNPQPLTLDPWKQYEGLAIGNQTVQELVHSLNTATAFLLICPLIGGALGLIFALAAQKD
jgi:hypothetical protein